MFHQPSSQANGQSISSRVCEITAVPVPLWCPVILAQTLGRRKELLTDRNLSGKGHGHQKERQAHRNELDDFIQWQIQLQVSNAIVPITVPKQGIREHRLGGCAGDRHAGNCEWQQKRPKIFFWLKVVVV